MRKGFLALAACSLAAAASSARSADPPAAPITVTGHAWAPFISPMGEPFRVRAAGDDPFVRWFNGADRNRDGNLTPSEMALDADRFFTALDSNHDGEIDPDELTTYEWEVAPEIQVNSKWRRKRGEPATASRGRTDDGSYDALSDRPQGAARYALLNIPEPVAAADADLNRGITRSEFRQAAADRFALLDVQHQGRLTPASLETLLPPPPKLGRHARRREDSKDSRIGIPLPPRD